MTFVDIAKVWHSAANAPSRDEIEQHHEQLVMTIQKRRRASLVGFVFIALALALQMGSLLQYVLSGGAFDVQREWASLLFLLLPILLLVVIVRRYLDHLRRHENYTSSIAESLRTFLDDARSQRWRLQLAMAGFTAGMLLLPLITGQLQEVGKQRAHEALSMTILFGVAYAVSMAGMYLKWRRLRGEITRLTQLVDEVDG